MLTAARLISKKLRRVKGHVLAFNWNRGIQLRLALWNQGFNGALHSAF